MGRGSARPRLRDRVFREAAENENVGNAGFSAGARPAKGADSPGGASTTLKSPFLEAAYEYRWLLDRGYPGSSALKLVGDHRQLDGEERLMLFRGVLSSDRSARNAAKLAKTFPSDTALTIDGYNVLFSVFAYLQGKRLFVSTDGFLRDAGGVHGRFKDEGLFAETVGLTLDCLRRLAPSLAVFALDAPVSNSARHAALIGEAAEGLPFKVTRAVVRSADYLLKETAEGMIATADSAVISSTVLPVFDLPRAVLEGKFDPDFPDFGRLVTPNSPSSA